MVPAGGHLLAVGTDDDLEGLPGEPDEVADGPPGRDVPEGDLALG